MILTLSDRTAAITTTLTPEAALRLLAGLPPGIRVRVRPDYERVLGTRVPSVQAHPPGYFGLTVAQAYDTWGQRQARAVAALTEEYQAYLRGKRPDPRD